MGRGWFRTPGTLRWKDDGRSGSRTTLCTEGIRRLGQTGAVIPLNRAMGLQGIFHCCHVQAWSAYEPVAICNARQLCLGYRAAMPPWIIKDDMATRCLSPGIGALQCRPFNPAISCGLKPLLLEYRSNKTPRRRNVNVVVKQLSCASYRECWVLYIGSGFLAVE